MKVIYEFTDDDREELQMFQQSKEMYWVLHAVKDELRSWVKYNSRNLPPEEVEGVYKFQTRFFEIINENQINLD